MMYFSLIILLELAQSILIIMQSGSSPNKGPLHTRRWHYQGGRIWNYFSYFMESEIAVHLFIVLIVVSHVIFARGITTFIMDYIRAPDFIVFLFGNSEKNILSVPSDGSKIDCSASNLSS